MCKNVPHVHAAIIKAWADNPNISLQVRPPPSGKFSPMWQDIDKSEAPVWLPLCEYRIKPEPKPDVISNVLVEFKHAWKSPRIKCTWEGELCPAGYVHNLDQNVNYIKFTFDGESDKLKSVEIVK